MCFISSYLFFTSRWVSSWGVGGAEGWMSPTETNSLGVDGLSWDFSWDFSRI